MALFKKTAPVEAPKAEAIEEQKPEKAVFTPIRKTMIGEGITLVGNFYADEPMEIKGTVDGNITSSKNVTIFEKGTLSGDAEVAAMTVHGYVNGSVKCNGLAVFSPTGKMDGSLTTKLLQTDSGSTFHGNLTLDLGAKQEIPETAAPAIDLSEEGDIPVTEEDLFN